MKWNTGMVNTGKAKPTPKITMHRKITDRQKGWVEINLGIRNQD